MIISFFQDEKYKNQFIKPLEEIFFLSSSKKNFNSIEEKEKFFHRWTDYYLKIEKKDLYLDIEKNILRAYLMGCRQSQSASLFYKDILPSYLLFEDLFSKFPAHLHINTHPNFRSLGIGANLIETFCNDLIKDQVLGLHIVTSPTAKNVSFYRRLGFSFECVRSWNSTDLLFMGRPLTEPV